MALVDEKVKESTTKVTLVKLEPGRLMNDLLALDAGVYEYTFVGEFNVFEIQRQGVALTEVSAIPTVDDTWYYTDNVLQIKLAAAPSGTNNIVAFHRIYLRDNYSIDDSLDMYHDRISIPPTFSQSVSNILGGVMTIARTSISIINNDSWFSKYLYQYDSFKNKNIEVSIVLNGVTVQSFNGKTGNVSSNEKKVRIEVYDIFSKITDTATMGDDLNEIRANKTTHTIRDADQDKAIPFVVGRTYGGFDSDPNNIYSTPTFGTIPSLIDVEKCPTATCTNYNKVSTTSVNREWTIARYSSAGRKTLSATNAGASISSITVYSAYNYGMNGGKLYHRMEIQYSQLAPTHTFEVGDTSRITTPSSGTFSFLVVSVVAQYVQCRVLSTSYGVDQDWTGATFSSTVDAPALVIKQRSDGELFVPLTSFHFSVTESTTSGGNKLLKVNFLNAFESDAWFNGRLNPISPDTHDIYFRLTTDLSYQGNGSSGHRYVLKYMFDSMGILYDDTSFTGNGDGLVFTVPYKDESSASSYLTYMQDILKSVGGYVYIDPSDYKARINLLGDAPSQSEISDIEIKKGTFLTDINTADIVSEVLVKNPYRSETHINNPTGVQDGDPSTLETYPSNKYLHGIDKRVEVKSLNSDTTESKAGVTRSRLIYTVKYDVPTQEIDATISEGRTITSTHAIGQDSTINGNSGIKTTITAVKVGSKDIEIEAINL